MKSDINLVNEAKMCLERFRGPSSLYVLPEAWASSMVASVGQ
jgi:hypothetical protein